MEKSNELPVEKKPFHESIVDIINGCLQSDLFCLATLIKRTTIPKNHDAIISAWKKRMEFTGSINDYGVPESVLGQKPVDYVQVMNSAVSLEIALEIGFDCLPLGESFVGPQGKISLHRNSLPKGDRDVAEIMVQDIITDKNIIKASWYEGAISYRVKSMTGERMEDWNNKW